MCLCVCVFVFVFVLGSDVSILPECTPEYWVCFVRLFTLELSSACEKKKEVYLTCVVTIYCNLNSG